MPAMAKIAATICGGEGWRRRQRVTDGRHAARSVVVKPCRDTGRRTLPPLGYSPQKSQASQDRACNGIINTLVLFYCEQTAHLAAMFPPSRTNVLGFTASAPNTGRVASTALASLSDIDFRYTALHVYKPTPPPHHPPVDPPIPTSDTHSHCMPL